MRRIRERRNDLLAIGALVVLSLSVGLYIVQHQRLRIPLLEKAPFTLKARFATAQAVVPGQGQTVRVAGVRIGDIGGTELVDGQAVITMELDPEYRDLVHTDATAFLRPKTGLKDMFVDLNPGTPKAPLAGEDFTMPISSTLPDVNPDEILASLDADTRDYLRLLIGGAGQGLRGRGGDLRDVLKRFEPTYRDLALVSQETVKRRAELRRLVHALDQLNGELAGRDDEIADLVRVAGRVFKALASEKANVRATVRELPGALAKTRIALTRVESMARVLRPAAGHLVPVARAMRQANEATAPFAREAAPIVRRDVRPFVRAMRPLVRELDPTVGDLVPATPRLTRAFTVLNHLFNMLAHNPRGREGPDVPGRDEGFLFYAAWLGHQSVNIFSNADAHGPQRALTLGGTCATIQGTAQSAPLLGELLGAAGVLTDPRVCGGDQASPSQLRRTPVGGTGR